MKKFLLLFSFLLILSTSHAQLKFDTLSHVQVGMGIYHTHVIERTQPQNINILEIDLTNPYNSVETVKANDRLVGLERTSSMASRNSYPGHIIVGGTNGDFYASGGSPTNAQISKGQLVKGPMNREIIAFDYDDKPMIATVTYNGKLFHGDTSAAISNVNTARNTNQLIFYNSFKGTSTGTNDSGTEVSIEPIDPWLVNDTIRAIVKSKISNQGNMNIESNRIVLSGHGTSQNFLNNLNIDDTVRIAINLSPGINKLKEAIGGSEKMIHNGVNTAAWLEIHPRTAAGFNQDSTKLFLVVVDGRSGSALGMFTTTMADFMMQLGVYQAINLDGGGSSTMVVRDNVVNIPSDGGERIVANSLLIVSSAPVGSTLNKIELTPGYQKFYHGETVKFNVSGWDEYFNPMDINSANVSFSLSHNFGSITSDGLFTAGNEPDTGYVFAEYNGLKDSSRIIVKTVSRIILNPKNAVTDTFKVLQFRTEAFDEDNVFRLLSNNQYQWTSLNSAVGTVDNSGNFRGKSAGTTKVIASYRGSSDTVQVTVVINEGSPLLDPLDDISGWSITGENVTISSSTVTISTDTLIQGSGSFKVNYDFVYDPAKLNYIYFNKDIPIEGAPEFIVINGKSDGPDHHISYLLSDENDEIFKVNTNKFLKQTAYFDTLRAPLANVAPVVQGSKFNFPAAIKQVIIKLASTRQSGQRYTGTIFIDNLGVQHPSVVTGIEDFENEIVEDFYLGQNYPNPFNPATRINYSIKEKSFITLKIYDILGNEIATLVNEEKEAGNYNINFYASSHASGVYIYILQVNFHEGSFINSRKMLLMK